MHRSATFLTVALMGLTALGCAKHTGSVVSDDPFAMEGDPFQAAEREMNASSTQHPTYAAKPSAPKPTQPAGWSRTGQNPTTTGNPTGTASTRSAMRFQASAPIPEIMAEKRVERRAMIPKQEPTADAKPMPRIQPAAYVEETTQDSFITQASYETTPSEPRPLPVTETQPAKSPASLEMPKFADEEISPTEEPAITEDEWWKK